MVTYLQVFHMHAVYAATMQCTNLALGIQIVGDILAIDLQVDRVEIKIFANIHGDKKCNLGVRRKQQLLFKQEQVPVQVEHLFFQ